VASWCREISVPFADQNLDIRSALKWGMAQLRNAEVPSPTLAAEVLLMYALGRDRTWMYSHHEERVDDAALQKYFMLIARRAAGEPTQYLTGHQEFWGLDFEVTPAVLIPRPETEHVMEVALARLGERGFKIHMDTGQPRETLQVADVGTGTGCLAVALAHELPHAELLATDISAVALEIARKNAIRNHVLERIRFVEADLFPSSAEPPTASFDLIVSNPPYIAESDAATLQREVRDHEPHSALFAGPTGTEIYERLVPEAAARLRDRGILVLELGYDSAGRVRELFDASSSSWTNVAIAMDLAAIPRVIAATRVR
jgi:release factor glutamine methyltransferase